MSERDRQAVPFFARYLEGQFCEDLSVEEMNEIHGGKRTCPSTTEHPLVSDDTIVMTLKFPSDQEDGGGGSNPITNKLKDEYAVTKKYPSDSDEHIAVTQKYPSDGDDDFAVLE